MGFIFISYILLKDQSLQADLAVCLAFSFLKYDYTERAFCALYNLTGILDEWVKMLDEWKGLSEP